MSSNPFVFMVTDPVPSMKNELIISTTQYDDGTQKTKVNRPAKIHSFRHKYGRRIAEKMGQMGAVRIEKPARVGVIVLSYRHQTTPLPHSDLDNQYTTIQEVLMDGGLIEDDCQVVIHFVTERKAVSKRAEFVLVIVWEISEEELPEDSFLTVFTAVKQKSLMEFIKDVN